MPRPFYEPWHCIINKFTLLEVAKVVALIMLSIQILRNFMFFSIKI